MEAAILYSGKYGSTRQYAQWLQELTGIAAFDIREPIPDLQETDFVVLGSSIILGAPTFKKWLSGNWEQFRKKPVLLFTVSGTAPDHPNLITWLNLHLSPEVLEHVKYVPLRGRLDLTQLPWWLRALLRAAASMTKDPDEAQRLREGFDYMDRDALEPIVEWIFARRRGTQKEVAKPQLEALEA
ncbi:MAG TPA: flavodoxin domain-containing protein [Robiginitalea sp.]|nr:flavodoxin domain-containing protein [Robiginitalea sp.]